MIREPTNPGDLPLKGLPNDGRLVTHHTIRPHWRCRWCTNLLAKTPTGAVVCTNCDYPQYVAT